MKIVEYRDCTFGMGTNPGGGIYVRIQTETDRERELFGGGGKIYERLVSHRAGIPTDGGPNPEWRKLVEYIGEPFWEKIKEMHQQYKKESAERARKLKIALATKVARGEFRAFRRDGLTMIHVIPLIFGAYTEHEFTFFPNGQNDLHFSNSCWTIADVKEGKLKEIKEQEMIERIKDFFASALDEI